MSAAGTRRSRYGWAVWLSIASPALAGAQPVLDLRFDDPAQPPLRLSPMAVVAEDDPLYQAEQRIRALAKTLPGLGARDDPGLADRTLRVLGLRGDNTIQVQRIQAQQASATFYQQLTGHDAVGELARTPFTPGGPIPDSDWERTLAGLLDTGG